MDRLRVEEGVRGLSHVIEEHKEFSTTTSALVLKF